MAGPENYDPTNTLPGWVRNNLTTSILAYRASVALKHAGSEYTTLNELGPEYAAKGMAHALDLKNLSENLETMYRICPSMRNRDDAGDLEMHDFMRGRGVLNEPGLISKIVENTAGGEVSDKVALAGQLKMEAESHYFAIVRAVDKVVSFATWSGHFQKAMDGKIEGIEAGDQEAASDNAYRAVREIKGSGGRGDLPRVLGSNNEWMKLFMSFMSQKNVIFNQMAKSIQQGGMNYGKAGAAVAAGPLFTAFMLKWMVPAIHNAVVTKGIPDKKKLASDLIQYPTEGIPGANMAVQYAAQKYIEGRPADMSLPVLQAGKDAMDTGHMAAVIAKDLATGHRGNISRQDVRAAANTAGLAYKLPGPMVFQALDYMDARMQGNESHAGPAESVWRATVAGRKR
jgi:hypothetical protein